MNVGTKELDLRLPLVDAMMLGIGVLKDWSQRMGALLTVVNWTGLLSMEQVAGARKEKEPKDVNGFESE